MKGVRFGGHPLFFYSCLDIWGLSWTIKIVHEGGLIWSRETDNFVSRDEKIYLMRWISSSRGAVLFVL